MKTKQFSLALASVALWLAVAPLQAQFVTWDRKAFGQQGLDPCGSPYFYPNNNNWTQQQVLGRACEQLYIAQPSNWSTLTYPNGASVDVSLGNGGSAPTNLDRGAPITVRSLTVLNVGGLTAENGSRLTANLLDFQGDGSLLVAGGGGPAPTFTLTSGCMLKKSGGIGAYTLDPQIFLQVLSAGTIASETGTLQLPSNGTTYAGGVNFNAAAGAIIDLAPAVGVVQISGQFTGSNVGGTVRLREGLLGTVPGSGGATFNFIGNTFQWQGGAIGGSAADPFINAGTMNITGAPGLSGQGFINQGTLAQSGSGAFNLAFGRVLTNAASGTFDIRNNNGITGIGGGGPGPVFNNYGTLRKSAGAGTSAIDRNINLNNIQGTIRVDTGTLVLAGGLTTRGGTGDGGAFVVATGATLQLTDGTNDAVYHGTYTGSGGGTVLMSAANLAPDVFNTGLTFNFPGSMFQWTGGAIGGYQSAVPVTNAGTMTLAGSAEKATFGNFNNNGTIGHTGTGRLGVSVPNSGGSFTNNAGGVYDLQSDAGLYSGPFNNSGLFKKSGGAGTSVVELPFNNTGTVAVSSGTLQFTGSVSQLNGATLTGGTWNVGANSTLTLGTGGGVITTNNGDVLLDGLNSNFTNLTNGGTTSLVNNGGAFRVRGGREISTTGALANSGTLRVAAGSTLRVGGNLSLAGSSTLSFGIGGPAVSGPQSAGVIQVNGSVNLAGQLSVNLPAGAAAIGDNDAIVLLTSNAPLTGAFTNVANNGQLATIDGTMTFFVHYGPGSTFDASRVVLTKIAGGPSSHPSFFTGEVDLGNNIYFLQFANGAFFGYYAYLQDPRFIYHFDMGYLYWFDGQDAAGSIYFYDFTSNSFFYTSPTFSFPYLYDFKLQAFLYYFPDPNNPQRYNTNGVRYFYNLNTGQIIVK